MKNTSDYKNLRSIGQAAKNIRISQEMGKARVKRLSQLDIRDCRGLGIVCYPSYLKKQAI